jgi:hypothetical protein
MYGHYHIFRQYANTKLPYRIYGAVQHGWNNGPGFGGDLSKKSKNEKLKKCFVWNRDNLAICKSIGYINAVAIGAPFIYLNKNVGKVDNGSLIVFPQHSWEEEPIKDVCKCYDRYLKELDKLKSKFYPITICLYWVEYENKEIVSIIKNRGFKVVTLNHRDNNPNFLINFQKVVSKYEYMTSNVFCSAIFYALYLNKKVFIMGPSFEIPSIVDSEFIRLYYKPIEFYKDRYPQLLWENFDDQPHREIAEMELGEEFKKPAEEIRRLFGWKPYLFVFYLVIEIGWRIGKVLLKSPLKIWRRCENLCRGCYL